MKPTTDSPVLEDLLQHDAWLRRLASEMVHDPATADDIVQETWVAAMQAPQVRAPKAWLRRVLGHRLHSHLRRRTIQRDAEVLAAGGTREERTAPAEEVPDVRVQLGHAIAELPEPIRQTLIDHYFHGKTSTQSATSTGVPEGTVRWRLKRGRDLLRDSLERRFGQDSARWLPGLALMARQPPATRMAMGAATTAPLVWAPWLFVGTLCALLTVYAVHQWSNRSETAVLASAATPAVIPTALPQRETSSNASPQLGPETATESRTSPQVETTANALPVSASPAGEAPVAEQAAALPVVPIYTIDAATKQVLAGVQIYVVGQHRTMRLVGTSDAGGRVSIAVPSEDFHNAGYFRIPDTVSLRLYAPGHAWSTVHSFSADLLADPPDGFELVVPLRSDCTSIRGQVTDGLGNPLAKANVRLGHRSLPQFSPSEGFTTTYMPLDTMTDAEGRFEIQGVPIVPLRLRVRAAGFLQGVRELTIEDEAPVELELALSAEALCQGTVRNNSGAPVPGARIWHDPYDSEPPLENQDDPYYSLELVGFASEVFADEHGRFVLDRLPNGPLRIWAQDPANPAQTSSTWVETSSAAPLQWDPILETRAPFEVHLQDHEGNPAAGKGLFLLSASEVSKGWRRTLEVPSDGVVRIHDWIDLPLEAIVLNRVWGGTAPLAFRKDFSPAQSPLVIQLPDPTPARLSGTVKDVTGKPPQESFVALANQAMEFIVAGRINFSSGTFWIDLPPGTYRTSVHVEGVGIARQEDVVLQPGEPQSIDLAVPETAPLHLIDRSGPQVAGSSYRLQAVQGWRTELQRMVVIEEGVGRPSKDLELLPGVYVYLYGRDDEIVSRTLFPVEAGVGGYLDPNGDGPALVPVRVLLDGSGAPVGTQLTTVTGSESATFGEEARTAEGLFLVPLGVGDHTLKALYPTGQERSQDVTFIRRGSQTVIVIDG